VLDAAISKGIILTHSLSEDNKQIIVEFKGPLRTAYENNIYKIKVVLAYECPLVLTQGFFVGSAPDHPFYSFDTDDSDRPKRQTNLANSIGLDYFSKLPSKFAYN
jgi:hypothetical protein